MSGNPGSIAVVLFVLWASTGVPGVTTAEPLGPRPAPGPPTRDDGGGDESEGTGLPLEVDRLVPRDMTEGSWISLGVSPDGETIVFDFLGDLFTVPIAGGDATQFTSGVAFDAHPRFRPTHRPHVRRRRRAERLGHGQRRLRLRGDLEGARRTGRVARVDAGRRHVVAAMGAFRLSGLPKLELFHVDGAAASSSSRSRTT